MTQHHDTDLAVVKPWASKIRKHLQTGIESFILAGHDLDAAVEDFKQRDDKHWKHAYSELLSELKISQQTAYTLRSIAKHPILSDPENYGSLPCSWSTLGELASLPAPELEKRIEAGEITPNLKRDQVRQWKQPNHPPAGGWPGWTQTNMKPIIFHLVGLIMPDDLTEQEFFEVGRKLKPLHGLFFAEAEEFVGAGHLNYRRVPAELLSFLVGFTNMGKLFWVDEIYRISSGRPVVGVLTIPNEQLDKAVA